jgi:hypothetical protein
MANEEVENVYRAMIAKRNARLQDRLDDQIDKLEWMETHREERLQALKQGDEDSKAARFTNGLCGPGYETIRAPQSPNKTRHRAEHCCYSIDREMEVLVIIMRDGSWIQYDGVDPVLWDVLKNSDSTDEFIRLHLDDAGTPWTKTSYQNLPRKRPDEFQFGVGQ